MTIMKIKAFSLFGGTVYLLAMERTGQWRRDGRPNMGLLIRETIEEAKDRWKGFTETRMYFYWGRRRGRGQRLIWSSDWDTERAEERGEEGGGGEKEGVVEEEGWEERGCATAVEAAEETERLGEIKAL
jgi:hypothetical protein